MPYSSSNCLKAKQLRRPAIGSDDGCSKNFLAVSRMLICCYYAIAGIVVSSAGPALADLSTKERIRIHKEWLERRAAIRQNVSTDSSSSTPKTTYLRKLIKFKNAHEPLSENDISFVPHFDSDNNSDVNNNRNKSDEHNGGLVPVNPNQQPAGEGNNNMSNSYQATPSQLMSDNAYGLLESTGDSNVDSPTEGTRLSLPLDIHSDRYRYELASENHLSNEPETGSGQLTAPVLQSRLLDHQQHHNYNDHHHQPAAVPINDHDQDTSNDIPPVTPGPVSFSLGQKSHHQLHHQQLHGNEIVIEDDSSGQEHQHQQQQESIPPTERVNPVAKVDEPAKSDQEAFGGDTVIANGHGSSSSGFYDNNSNSNSLNQQTHHHQQHQHRSDPQHQGVINNETTEDETTTIPSQSFSSTESPDLLPPFATTEKTVEDADQLPTGNVTIRNGFGPWSNWTACSRSCGGGVKSQNRKCWRRE
ncbi:GATA zinc finger domain-containing protein 14-like [Uranotaenia lowii]|uniref:GATA zinc finger domain-containing protein 14-like n=1 Tax=Uranotaenia lowii TaxID=190385 RepID=UPI002479A736|nr:GATA zinc finger domain-containing protein 14-like [Uranotaenia lowii]